jgi:transcription initiation factor TFIID subunit 5
VLTQSKEDFLMDLKIRNEITRTNSFTFSNISSLNGSQSPVDSQVNKLIKFIQCQKNSLVRKELQNLLPPLVCHLFVEMLKGKEWRPAHEFLRKYSSLLGTFQEITPQRINGTDPSTLMPQKIYFLPHSTNSTSQMKFASTSKQPQIAQLNIEEQKLNLFRELVTTLSCIKDLQDTNDNKIISFRSSKYKAHLSRKSHAILKKYLARDAHVLITQVIHSWFSWDLYELHEDSNDSSSPSSPEMLTTTNNNNFDFNSSENNSMVARHQQHRNNVNRFSSECDNQKDIKFNYNNNRLDSPQIEQQTTNYDMNETNEFFGSNLKLKRLHESLNRVNSKYHKPIRIFNINYTENR